MQTETIIQSITVGQNLQRTYTVGDEVNGREVNEIKAVGSEFEDHVHSEFWVLDEDNELITCIENMPVVVEYKTIATDGPAPIGD